MQQSLSTPKENDLSPSTEAGNSDVIPQQPPVQPKMNERKCFFKKWETFVLLVILFGFIGAGQI